MPANLVRRLLRSSVLKTNPYRYSDSVVENYGRELYAAAIEVFVSTFRSRPEICRIYLRN
jgi:hypothetical protein